MTPLVFWQWPLLLTIVINCFIWPPNIFVCSTDNSDPWEHAWCPYIPLLVPFLTVMPRVLSYYQSHAFVHKDEICLTFTWGLHCLTTCDLDIHNYCTVKKVWLLNGIQLFLITSIFRSFFSFFPAIFFSLLDSLVLCTFVCWLEDLAGVPW